MASIKEDAMTKTTSPAARRPARASAEDPQEEDAAAVVLTSDRMALAAAEGRLEEFLQHEIPEGDHARTLAMMMMGMSGMMPTEMPPEPPGQAPHPPDGRSRTAHPTRRRLPAKVPPEVLAAIQQGGRRQPRRRSCAPSTRSGPARAGRVGAGDGPVAGRRARTGSAAPRRRRAPGGPASTPRSRRVDPHRRRQRRDRRLADAARREALRGGVPEDRPALRASITWRLFSR